MRTGIRVFDADRHVMEPPGIWARYLEPAFRDEAPTMPRGTDLVLSNPAGGLPPIPRPAWRGQPLMRPAATAAERAKLDSSVWPRLDAIRAASTGAGQLASMDRQGVDAAALMPTAASFLVGVDDMPPPVAHAFARAYNRWLADLCTAGPERLVPVGLVARHDPARMVADVEAVLARGWRAVVLRPDPVGGRTLGHADLAPFWARCAEAGVLVVLHGGSRARLPTAGTERFTSQFGVHACAHVMEAMMALLALVDGRVLHRHPTLRIALLEAGCGWVPHWLWRLDETWKATAPVSGTTALPSQVILRACVLGFEPSEPMVAETARALGPERLIFGTDFPHVDHDDGLIQKAVGMADALGRGAFERMMGANAAALFGQV